MKVLHAQRKSYQDGEKLGTPFSGLSYSVPRRWKYER